MRFPFLLRRLALVVSRLSRRSRLRRALLRRALLSGWASFDRREYELNFFSFAPDAEFEFEFPPSLQPLGLAGSFRGPEGRIEALNKLFEVWTSELEPTYLLDLGDRLLNLGFWHTQAHASRVPLQQEVAQLVTLRNGLIIRDQTYFSWEEGLRAAGLEPDALREKTSSAASSAR